MFDVREKRCSGFPIKGVHIACLCAKSAVDLRQNQSKPSNKHPRFFVHNRPTTEQPEKFEASSDIPILKAAALAVPDMILGTFMSC